MVIETKGLQMVKSIDDLITSCASAKASYIKAEKKYLLASEALRHAVFEASGLHGKIAITSRNPNGFLIETCCVLPSTGVLFSVMGRAINADGTLGRGGCISTIEAIYSTAEYVPLSLEGGA